MLGAVLLGDRFGFESVAIAWAVGYPIAFTVLIYMATHTLGFSVMRYFRAVSGVAGCMILAGAAAAGVRFALSSAPTGIKLGATAVTVLVVAGFLLAYTQGLSLRTARRALKEPPADQADT
jgi:hypothetical protein